MVLLLVAVLMAILAPIFAQLLYYACSRRREYLADASAAQFTRYPQGLASALEKISRNPTPAADVSKVVAPMYIVNPLQARAAFSLFSTHPPTEKRISVLRSMAGAGLAAYEEAYRKLHGDSSRCIGEQSLAEAEEQAIWKPTDEPASPEEAVKRAVAVGAVLDKVLPMLVIGCPCGVRLKVPPEFKKPKLSCPRCGSEHEVPKERGKAGSERVTGKATPGAIATAYRRKFCNDCANG